MSWSAMVEKADEQLRTDHGMAQAYAESASVNSHRWGSSWRQGHRTGWWQGVEWVLNAQTGWDGLTEYEAITELRKGSGSIYWPLFREDPVLVIECPEDGRVTIGVQGFCDACGWEVT